MPAWQPTDRERSATQMEAAGRQLLQTTKESSLWGDKLITLVGPHGENVTTT